VTISHSNIFGLRNFSEKIGTHILCLIKFSPKIVPFMR